MKSAEQWEYEYRHNGDLIREMIKKAQTEAYIAGQKRGHEDAAQEAAKWSTHAQVIHGQGSPATAIRNLPIQPLPESQPTQDKGE